MAFSYSFHISAKSHAVTNVGKVEQVGKHNLRAYEGKGYDRNLIETVVGTDNLLADMERVYHEEFDQALEKYNEGKRADRKIDDYMTHVSDSRSDVGVEIIIQVGDEDFWKDKSMAERKLMSRIFEEQIEALDKHCPSFKVANATIHYDEKSPHLHLVGVPVAEGYKKGMERQCAKTKVFTTESLSMLQDVMRAEVEQSMKRFPSLFADMELKAKEKGRNKDIPKHSLTEFYELEAKKEMLQSRTEELDTEISKKSRQVNSLAHAHNSLTDPQRTEPVSFITSEGEKSYMPLPELKRQSEAMSIQLKENERRAQKILADANDRFDSMMDSITEYEASEKQKIDAELEPLKAEISSLEEKRDNTRVEAQKAENRLSSVQEISKYMADDTRKGIKVKSQEIKDGMFSSHTAVVVEGLEAEQVRDIFRASAMKNGAVSEAQSIVQQGKAEADQMREQAQREIQQANNIISQQQQIIQQANEQAEQIKEKARKSYNSLIESAKAQANEIVTSAKETLANLKAEISSLFHQRDSLQVEVDSTLEKAKIQAEEIVLKAHEKLGTDALYEEINDRLGIVPLKEVADAREKLFKAVDSLGDLVTDKELAMIENGDVQGVYKALEEKVGSFSDMRPWSVREALDKYIKLEQSPHTKEEALEEIQHTMNRSIHKGISR